jgi:hypothetical protein
MPIKMATAPTMGRDAAESSRYQALNVAYHKVMFVVILAGPALLVPLTTWAVVRTAANQTLPRMMPGHTMKGM